MKNINESKYEGEIYPINPKSDEILGHKVYKTVSDVPNEIELVIVCIPARFIVPVVQECGEKGVKSLVIITAGFKEVGIEGAKLEKQIIEIAKKYEMRVVGPNCLGIITNGNFSFANFTPKKGEIGMLSQSGAMMTGLLDWAIEQDIGFSAFISYGNKCDVDAIDFIEYLAQDDNTKVIAAYIESIADGDKFFRVISKVTKKKPVILLKSGRSAQGAKAASSHTGALAGNDTAFDLGFEKSGVIRANTISELFNYSLAFQIASPPKGDKIAVVTNAGGPGIVTTDAMEAEGIAFADFSAETKEKMMAVLPAEASVHNPVDIVGDASPQRYKDTLEVLYQTSNNEVAGSIVLLTPQAQTEPKKAAEYIAEIAQKYPEKLTIAAFIGGLSIKEAAKILTKSGVPTYAFPEEAVNVLKVIQKYGHIKESPIITEKEVVIIPDTPEAQKNRSRVSEIIASAKEDRRTQLLSHENAEIFELYGINAPKSRLARTAAEAIEQAEELGYPLVAKIVSPQIIHKWDVGGVILNIENKEQVKDAFLKIMNNVKQFSDSARIYGIEIQQMITKDDKEKINELIFGMSRDPNFGPQLMVGSGGIYANYIKDVAFDLAFHFDKEDALKLIKKTNIYTILNGVRGEKRSDLDGVCTILTHLSQLVNDFPQITELDINPCLVFEAESGYSAVDIKITIK